MRSTARAALLTGPVALLSVREALRGRVPRHHLRRHVIVAKDLPRTGPGKPDSHAGLTLLQAAVAVDRDDPTDNATGALHILD